MEVNNEPLVSVLMTSYNREQYIAAAIESVLASTYSNFELLIVDDLSHDKTVKIATSYLAKDGRIQLYINEKNLGDYPNRNNAVGLAKGKYIMFCDSDDMFFPDSINYCIDAMEINPEAKFGIYYAGKAEHPFLLSPNEVLKRNFFNEPILNIGPGGTIINREFFFEINGYPEKYGPANDMYFNIKAAANSNVLFLPKLFLNYRLHENQEKNNHFGYLHNGYNYLKDALSELSLPLTDKQKNWLLLKNKRRFLVNITRYYFKTWDLKKTRQAIEKTNYGFKDAMAALFH
jgi:glycosyltransferase involved in cell wall biosynthesis